MHYVYSCYFHAAFVLPNAVSTISLLKIGQIGKKSLQYSNRLIYTCNFKTSISIRLAINTQHINIFTYNNVNKFLLSGI